MISTSNVMSSLKNTLKVFTDLATDRIAREIAIIRREAQREKEFRDSEHRARMAEWDLKIAAVADLQRQLTDRLAKLKDGTDGKTGTDGKDGADGKDGSSVTIEDMVPVLGEKIFGLVESQLSTWERPKDGQDGKSVTVDDMLPVVKEAVQQAMAAIPVPKDGRDGVDGKDGERGPEGAPGKLPVVREWQDQVHYEGAVVRFEGSTYQALRDTGRGPPHEDWICLAAAGQDGVDGRAFAVRGTWSESEQYFALDVVALGGAGFVARRDNPGPCPGEGWQLIASQGKRGNQGDRGLKGDKGDRGEMGHIVLSAEVDSEGLLMIMMSDGSKVCCDLYDVLARR